MRAAIEIGVSKKEYGQKSVPTSRLRAAAGYEENVVNCKSAEAVSATRPLSRLLSFPGALRPKGRRILPLFENDTNEKTRLNDKTRAGSGKALRSFDSGDHPGQQLLRCDPVRIHLPEIYPGACRQGE